MIPMMKWIVPLLAAALLATPAIAQPEPQVLTGRTPVTDQSAWGPAGPYIAAGQDEPGYRSWYLAAPSRAAQVKAFNDYLAGAQVAGIVPTWQLLRTATSWKDCGAEPFEVPPTSEWPHIVQTLRYVRDQVIPVVGPVEPVSVYRNPILNQCAGGAVESAHKMDSAIDMVPLKPITREVLIKTLCDRHTAKGEPYQAGLGFYAFIRFHVDSMKFRRWNMDPEVLALCPPLIHPEDIASVGRPMIVTAPGSATVPLGTPSAPVTAPSAPMIAAPPVPAPTLIPPAPTSAQPGVQTQHPSLTH